MCMHMPLQYLFKRVNCMCSTVIVAEDLIVFKQSMRGEGKELATYFNV